MWHFTLLYNFPCEKEKKKCCFGLLNLCDPLSFFFFSIFTQWLMDFVWRWTMSDTVFFSVILFINQIIWVKKKKKKTSLLVVPLVQMSYCLNVSAYVSVSRKSALKMSHQLLFPFVCLMCHVPYGLCYYPATDLLIDYRYIMMFLRLLTGRVKKRLWKKRNLKSDWHCKKKQKKTKLNVFDLPRYIYIKKTCLPFHAYSASLLFSHHNPGFCPLYLLPHFSSSSKFNLLSKPPPVLPPLIRYLLLVDTFLSQVQISVFPSS